MFCVGGNHSHLSKCLQCVKTCMASQIHVCIDPEASGEATWPEALGEAPLSISQPCMKTQRRLSIFPSCHSKARGPPHGHSYTPEKNNNKMNMADLRFLVHKRAYEIFRLYRFLLSGRIQALRSLVGL